MKFAAHKRDIITRQFRNNAWKKYLKFISILLILSEININRNISKLSLKKSDTSFTYSQFFKSRKTLYHENNLVSIHLGNMKLWTSDNVNLELQQAFGLNWKQLPPMEMRNPSHAQWCILWNEPGFEPRFKKEKDRQFKFKKCKHKIVFFKKLIRKIK